MDRDDMTGADENAALARYRGVSDPELLRAHGLFVAEGRLVVRRVIADSRFEVVSVLVNDSARRELDDVLRALPPDAPVFVRDTAEFARLSGYHIHRGCLALVRRPPMTPVADLLRTGGPLVLLERVTDPDNVGSVFRGASAFAASGVILSPGCGDPFYRKTVRTSVGGVLLVPFALADDWSATLAAVRSAGFVLAALTPRQPSIPLGEFAAARAHARIALLVGTEGDGLAPETESAADVRVRIVTAPGVDSLNVSVAATIALHAVSRVVDEK